ncbi:hypothetical protein [Streptomyces camelliae]|uniref:Uncharacterized protein n=1 Tax=Streptomyces camelliae TaxID=3004093 RepID=A0ABY7NUM4_9ACTN|nr:hypothetical protein [Streptomyces sp. HUAS 2-6]WBO61882.1 hypothetical protein O1G22_03020 [Streptomyces sp. HUAS 2-6]
MASAELTLIPEEISGLDEVSARVPERIPRSAAVVRPGARPMMAR